MKTNDNQRHPSDEVFESILDFFTKNGYGPPRQICFIAEKPRLRRIINRIHLTARGQFDGKKLWQMVKWFLSVPAIHAIDLCKAAGYDPWQTIVGSVLKPHRTPKA